jgi:hypothetical protein
MNALFSAKGDMHREKEGDSRRRSMMRGIALLAALVVFAFAANGWAMGAGETQQPADPLPREQEREWAPPEREFDQEEHQQPDEGTWDHHQQQPEEGTRDRQEQQELWDQQQEETWEQRQQQEGIQDEQIGEEPPAEYQRGTGRPY